ncbi:MAG: hypothetical protein AAF039_14190 [Bacteroidota bacterium]
MAFGAQANNIIKANRALLKKKRTFKEIKGSYLGYVKEGELKFKELTPFEQKKIRDKIIIEAKRERKKQILASLLSILILGSLSYGIYFLVIKPLLDSQ